MRLNNFFRVGCVLSAIAAVTTLVRGYVLQTDESGIYIVKWEMNTVPLRVMLDAERSLSDGNTQSSSVRAAINSWNTRLGAVQLQSEIAPPGDYAVGNGVSEIVLDDTVDGDAFPEGIVAITVLLPYGNEKVENDIIFNSAYDFDSYRGLSRDRTDIMRVALHELGHLLGLNHPDDYGQSVTAIMNSSVTNTFSLQTDDLAGVQHLYGAKNFVPENDAFAAAVTIALGVGAVQLEGVNIAATPEQGEPEHADSVGARSVWWKWTAPSDGTFGLNTMGSEFDTVVGIYTGVSVDALTKVAANDDVDSGVIRTSAVSFAARAGTTYYVVVAGWGDWERELPGYTGWIVLNASFTTDTLAPLISAQPEHVAAARGSDVTLAVQVRSDAQVRWQWNGYNLPDATNPTLILSDLQPDEVGIYRAVVTAGGEAALSSRAIVGLVSDAKIAGEAIAFGDNILHANGITFDQVLLQGGAASIRADPGQVVRMSFEDITGDIVQLEFSGAGTLTTSMFAFPPALATSYNQPGIEYVLAHGGVVITGADETTNLTVFSVGRKTAVNQALFRDDVDYEGMANLSYVAIMSANGKFGGLRTANTLYVDSGGIVGLYAPAVHFEGPIYLGDIYGGSTVQPTIVVGQAAEVWITGGSLEQDDDVPVEVEGFARLRMKPGTDSHGNEQPAQTLATRLMRNGVDVTDELTSGN